MSANPNNQDTCGLHEACEILHVSPATLRRRVKAGIVPGAKPGKRLVFVRADLLQFVRANYKKQPCFIGIQSPHTSGHGSSSTDEKSAEALRQRIARKRKHTKPALEILSGGRSD